MVLSDDSIIPCGVNELTDFDVEYIFVERHLTCGIINMKLNDATWQKCATDKMVLHIFATTFSTSSDIFSRGDDAFKFPGEILRSRQHRPPVMIL